MAMKVLVQMFSFFFRFTKSLGKAALQMFHSVGKRVSVFPP